MVKYTFRGLFALYLSALFFLSLYSFHGVEIKIPSHFLGVEIDKVIHFLMFLPFPFFAWFAFSSYFIRFFGKYSKLILFICGIALATIIELLQSFSMYRDSNPLDLLANYIGVVMGSIIVCIIDKYIKEYLE